MTPFPKAVVFDLDDTLFDHRHASACALRSIHAHHAPHVDVDAFAAEHARVLEVYHAGFLEGRYTLDEARAARMIELFAGFGIDIDTVQALQIGARYRRLHQENRRLVAGAPELLDALRGRAKLGIVTNNAAAEQRAKLEHLGIARHFDAVVISEEAGCIKPDTQIFRIALERLDCAPHEAVMVGDNWRVDVQGALRAGMPALWFNRGEETHTAPGVWAATASFTPLPGTLELIGMLHRQAAAAMAGATATTTTTENGTRDDLQTLAS